MKSKNKILDKYGHELHDGSLVMVQDSGVHRVYLKEDNQLYFRPYKKEEPVKLYFRDDLVKMAGDRSIKDLLNLTLENQELFDVGLCNWFVKLLGQELISSSEFCRLYEYIDKNRPSKFSSIEAFLHRNISYFWNPGNIKPRIKWLKKHIKLNQ
jgi:hypothetical protein